MNHHEWMENSSISISVHATGNNTDPWKVLWSAAYLQFMKVNFRLIWSIFLLRSLSHILCF